MNLKENVQMSERLTVVHYDPAWRPGGKPFQPKDKAEWDALGVKAEIGRYANEVDYEARRPFDVSRFGLPDMKEGLLTNIGSNYIWRLVCGSTSPGAGAGTTTRPRTNTLFNNANSFIGVGTSSTAAAASQTDLQAATGPSNRQFKGMNNNTQVGTVAVPSNAPTFPLLVGAQDGTSGTIFYYDATGASTNVLDQQAVFQSTFLSGEANFATAWQEFCVYNANAGTSNTNTTDNVMLDRFISNQGIKVSGQISIVTITFTLA